MELAGLEPVTSWVQSVSVADGRVQFGLIRWHGAESVTRFVAVPDRGHAATASSSTFAATTRSRRPSGGGKHAHRTNRSEPDPRPACTGSDSARTANGSATRQPSRRQGHPELGLRVQARLEAIAERRAGERAAERGGVLEEVVAREDDQAAELPHRDPVRAPRQLARPA